MTCSNYQWDWGAKADQIFMGEIIPSKMRKSLILYFLTKTAVYHIENLMVREINNGNLEEE